MSTGTVDRLIHDAYGFIVDTTGARFFFHRADTQGFGALLEGDTVHFEVVSPRPEKGPRAISVVRLDPVTAAEQPPAA